MTRFNFRVGPVQAPQRKSLQPIAWLVWVFAASPVWATNGYFSHGIGIRSQSLAGATVALPTDSLTGASNPAAITEVPDRLDLAVTTFLPKRGATIEGSLFPGLNGEYDGNDKTRFYIPEFGVTRRLNEQFSFGFAMFGNGGLNTGYNKNPFAGLGSSGRAGVDLAQLFINPVIAFKPFKGLSVGAGPNLIYQRFFATGLQAFDNALFSSAPGKVTNNGYSHSLGYNIRTGIYAEPVSWFSAGYSLQTKADMTPFKEYKGLFAHQGDFDIPRTTAVGFAIKPRPSVVLSVETQRISYSQIPSVNNSFNVNNVILGGDRLGTDNGPGFGWRDMKVLKVGVQVQPMEKLTVRMGRSVTRQPVPASETLLNILAPGVVEKHYSFGASYAPDATNEWTLHYTRAPAKTVYGQNSVPLVPLLGGESNIYLQEKIFSLGYSRRL